MSLPAVHFHLPGYAALVVGDVRPFPRITFLCDSIGHESENPSGDPPREPCHQELPRTANLGKRVERRSPDLQKHSHVGEYYERSLPLHHAMGEHRMNAARRILAIVDSAMATPVAPIAGNKAVDRGRTDCTWPGW